jgi:hypothetical protein
MRLVFWTSTLFAVLGSTAQAALLRVPSQYPSIQSAIDSAAFGDTVLVAPGTYTNCDEGPCTESVVEVIEGLTLLSEGGRDVTRLELHPGPGGSPEVVDVRWIGPGGAVVRGFEITTTVFTNRLGMAIIGSENIDVSGCRFVDLQSTITAGAGVFQNGGTAEIVDCEFIRCTAVGEAGGLKVIGSPTGTRTVVRDCLFEECGPTAMLVSGGGDVEVTGCVFRNNFGGVNAGGLSLSQNESAYVSDCWFEGNVSSSGAGGLVVAGPADADQLIIERCVFLRNQTSGGGGGGARLAANSLLRMCTFVGNDAPAGSGVRAQNSSVSHEVRNCVFALNLGGAALDDATSGASAVGDCNVLWQNVGGDYSNWEPGPNDQSVDPEFCDIPADDYTVRNTSPCAEENSPVCGQIGAYGIGCGTVSVEPTSWSRVKSWYREEE